MLSACDKDTNWIGIISWNGRFFSLQDESALIIGVMTSLPHQNAYTEKGSPSPPSIVSAPSLGTVTDWWCVIYPIMWSHHAPSLPRNCCLGNPLAGDKRDEIDNKALADNLVQRLWWYGSIDHNGPGDKNCPPASIHPYKLLGKVIAINRTGRSAIWGFFSLTAQGQMPVLWEEMSSAL